jgi:hypothetical protein
MIFSLNAMSSSFTMKLESHQKMLLKETAEDEFTQYYIEKKGNYTLKLRVDGEEFRIDHDIPLEITNSDEIQMTLQRRNRKLRYIDTKEEIDKLIPAKINKTILRRIKSVVIKNKVMLRLYRESFEKQGLSLLETMNLEFDSLTLIKSFDFSKLKCLEIDKDLSCEYLLSITISNETEQ